MAAYAAGCARQEIAPEAPDTAIVDLSGQVVTGSLSVGTTRYPAGSKIKLSGPWVAIPDPDQTGAAWSILGTDTTISTPWSETGCLGGQYYKSQTISSAATQDQ